MSETNPRYECEESEESTPIQVDLYGVKLRTKPTPTADATKRITLRGLLDDISQSLLRVARDSFGLVADVFTGARSIIRGVAALPTAVASRVGRAHQIAEKCEIEAEEGFDFGELSEEAKDAAVEHLVDTLNQIRAQGIPVSIDRLPSGQIIFSVLRPDHNGIAADLATKAVAGYLPNAPEVAGSKQADPSEVGESGSEDKPLPATPTDATTFFAIRNIPISDFELSARSRNALQKMGIRTLGDLTQVTEQELLASKNFGESSLVEIRDMLVSKGLELGQDKVIIEIERESANPVELTSDEKALLQRPLSDLNLSIMARKGMVRMGLSTIGELVQKKSADLLEVKRPCKDFCVTLSGNVICIA